MNNSAVLDEVREAAIDLLKAYISFSRIYNTCKNEHEKFRDKMPDVGLDTNIIDKNLVSSEYFIELKNESKNIAIMIELAQTLRNEINIKNYSMVANKVLSNKNSCMECLLYADMICRYRASIMNDIYEMNNYLKMVNTVLNFLVAMCVAQRSSNKILENSKKKAIMTELKKTTHEYMCSVDKIEQEYENIIETKNLCKDIWLEEYGEVDDELINKVSTHVNLIMDPFV
jgi:hypothetical protein